MRQRRRGVTSFVRGLVIVVAACVVCVGGATAADPLGTVTEYANGLTAGNGIYTVAAGSDGQIWFDETNLNQIGQIDPQTGHIVEHTLPAGVGATLLSP